MISYINIEKALYRLTKGHEVFEEIRNLLKHKNCNMGLLWDVNYEEKLVTIILFKIYSKIKCIILKNNKVHIIRYSIYDEKLKNKYTGYIKYLQLIKVEPFYDYCLKNKEFLDNVFIMKNIIKNIINSNCISLRNENDFIKYKPMLNIIYFLEQNKIFISHNIYYCICDNIYIIGDKNTNKYRLIQYKNNECESESENKLTYLRNTIMDSSNELVAYYDNFKIDISYSYNINKLISIICKENHNYIKIMINKIDYCKYIKNLVN